MRTALVKSALVLGATSTLVPVAAQASLAATPTSSSRALSPVCGTETKFKSINTSFILCVEQNGSKARAVIHYLNTSDKSQLFRPVLLRVWNGQKAEDVPCLNPDFAPYWLVPASQNGGCESDWVFVGASSSYATTIVKDVRSESERSSTTPWPW
ncbi:hypothetical protein [Actinomadura hibisca]|uniref:hypothetical protein n=1 Tax=Actinomadura hibisca TaxID=68565 RepID=UPI00082B247B|nr:hypothetical protein [Actinomadura hibisca]